MGGNGFHGTWWAVHMLKQFNARRRPFEIFDPMDDILQNRRVVDDWELDYKSKLEQAWAAGGLMLQIVDGGELGQGQQKEKRMAEDIGISVITMNVSYMPWWSSILITLLMWRRLVELKSTTTQITNSVG